MSGGAALRGGNLVVLPVHYHPGSDRVGAWLSCKGVILVEEHGHSPPPLPNFSWGSENLSLSYVLCTWPAIRRNLSLFYLLVVAFFKFASVFGDGWPTVCVIDAELAPFYGTPMVG